MTETEFVAQAAKVRRNAYAPFSKFQVGAIVETTAGNTFTGCNVENSSYGLSMCAERNAIGAMVATVGPQPIKRIAIVANRLASPCGACRQVISEFGSEIVIISAAADNLEHICRWTIADLLPDSFKL